MHGARIISVRDRLRRLPRARPRSSPRTTRSRWSTPSTRCASRGRRPPPSRSSTRSARRPTSTCSRSATPATSRRTGRAFASTPRRGAAPTDAGDVGLPGRGRGAAGHGPRRRAPRDGRVGDPDRQPGILAARRGCARRVRRSHRGGERRRRSWRPNSGSPAWTGCSSSRPPPRAPPGLVARHAAGRPRSGPHHHGHADRPRAEGRRDRARRSGAPTSRTPSSTPTSGQVAEAAGLDPCLSSRRRDGTVTRPRAGDERQPRPGLRHPRTVPRPGRRRLGRGDVASGTEVIVHGEGAGGAARRTTPTWWSRRCGGAFDAWRIPQPGLRTRVPQRDSAGARTRVVRCRDRRRAPGGRGTGRRTRLVSDAEALAFATALEGHADNVAACLLGGLTIAWTDEGSPHAVRLDVDERIVPVVFCADQPTVDDARARTAPERGHRTTQASANSAHTALLVAALTRRPDLLLPATVRPSAPGVPALRPCRESMAAGRRAARRRGRRRASPVPDPRSSRSARRRRRARWSIRTRRAGG